MKIRTITTGINLNTINEHGKIEKAAEFNRNAKEIYEEKGYAVQTTRVSTNSWEEYTSELSNQEILMALNEINSLCQKEEINFFNIGYAADPAHIEFIPEIIQSAPMISASAKIGDIAEGMNYSNIRSSAKVIKKIAGSTDKGFGNFRFCAWSNCPPGIPFFPASYHEEEHSAFAIGLECGDLAMQAFTGADDLESARHNLKEVFTEKLVEISLIAEQISREHNLDFLGVDSSLAPGLRADESVAYAYEKLLSGKFGSQGTLAISSMITDVLKNLSVKTCGYSGLMLPVCEDVGLAERANQKSYNITNLLLYSAVCGCGLDTVPVPGEINNGQLEAILRDTASLAIKLDKPLSVRLFPVPGKKAGQTTNFQSQYLTDCKILAVG
jgi:hypothetical protein